MPRNSDEAVDWPEEDSTPDLRAVIRRIELAEDSHFDNINPNLEEPECPLKTPFTNEK